MWCRNRLSCEVLVLFCGIMWLGGSMLMVVVLFSMLLRLCFISFLFSRLCRVVVIVVMFRVVVMSGFFGVGLGICLVRLVFCGVWWGVVWVWLVCGWL